MISDYNSQKSVKHLYFFFIITSFTSFLYAVFKGRLNGDFLGVEVVLPFWLLVINLLFTILPFIVTWKIYLYFKKKKINKCITMPVRFFEIFLIFLIIWNVAVTLIYGVGVLAAPPYEAPPIIKPIIQIMNRFNYFYGAFIYILLVPKKNKFQFLLVILLLVLAYLRAGLGVLLYFGMLFYIKYFVEVNLFFKKQKIIILILLFFFPIVVNGLYELRSILRGQETEETYSDPILGVLMGRLSSFSDSAFIMQEAPVFFISAQELDPLYFQKQALGGVLSLDYMPAHRPETMLFKFYYENSEDNVAYMAGTQGNLYLSLFKSPLVLVLNILTIFLYIISTFIVFRMLRFEYANELAFMLLLYVLMSGVSNEYAFLIFSIFVYVVLFMVVNFLNFKKKDENSLYST
ncbi:hypothetical protein SAMN06265349_105308 [Flavobacterium resistens]|uniref:Oligosaccharide repeat unit polymerase n=1 Tax=Flavobacterium resistens TaxID=443612 RepID=A0A521ERT5_9FLAO|nr:oligosaccharide repeat unit polymerase [Flavobacterium resistens]MRX67932.1 oligosaccharide repeat unit polymerase [Flavobacterium resistens]SMO86643.1 hypothetical protein SAMN06265349_105308 [Flavobacterium resistens]